MGLCGKNSVSKVFCILSHKPSLQRLHSSETDGFTTKCLGKLTLF